jgi:hypothetical protein
MIIVRIKNLCCFCNLQHFPAKNLLTNKKWRTEKDGDSSATVIIQLERETKISKIDIGNNGSAFVEVLVGKSSAPEKDYEAQFTFYFVSSMKLTFPSSIRIGFAPEFFFHDTVRVKRRN